MSFGLAVRRPLQTVKRQRDHDTERQFNRNWNTMWLGLFNLKPNTSGRYVPKESLMALLRGWKAWWCTSRRTINESPGVVGVVPRWVQAIASSHALSVAAPATWPFIARACT